MRCLQSAHDPRTIPALWSGMLARRMTPHHVASDEQDRYQAYLLRLWRSKSRGRWSWRASLESPRTGERQLFACLEQLFAFLNDKTHLETPESGADIQDPRPGSVPLVEEERYDG